MSRYPKIKKIVLSLLFLLLFACIIGIDISFE